ncbi:MAG: 4Fe-4S binding protein [Candidatus Riflebacteria bacterium]|nr:4Fe-4S binding protein [Candidatus Riflebacteria bacterium]
MIATAPAMHYVCTHDEARELCSGRSPLWVSNCGCREGKGACGRSRMDVCVMFTGDQPGSGSGKREISPEEMAEILQVARAKGLVARPFRDESRKETVGVCFCCDDCCAYFLSPEERCDPGTSRERTDMEACTHCGACVDVCFFKARVMTGETLKLDRKRCYGCGLCVPACPVGCVQMVPRKGRGACPSP